MRLGWASVRRVWCDVRGRRLSRCHFDCGWLRLGPGRATLTAVDCGCDTLKYAGKSRPNAVIPVLWGASTSGFQPVLENRLKFHRSTPVIQRLQAFPLIWGRYSTWHFRTRLTAVTPVWGQAVPPWQRYEIWNWFHSRRNTNDSRNQWHSHVIVGKSER